MDTPFSTWATVEEASSSCTLLPHEPPPRVVPPLQLPSNARQALEQHFQQQQPHQYPQQQQQPPILTEAPTRRMSSLISTLASIDELEPLLLDDLAPAVVMPPPPLAQRLTASQAADMVRGFARNLPGGALTPCPNGLKASSPSAGGGGKAPMGLPPAAPKQSGQVAHALVAGLCLPVPALPPIVTRVADRSSVHMPVPGLKIKTPRRHFGHGMDVENQ
ncbi:hypothetical protein N2152v2_008113 [Parachlorella kessleri]